MDSDSSKDKEEEIIVLSDLQFLINNEKEDNHNYNYEEMLYYPIKMSNKIKIDQNKLDKFKNESIELYYKLDNQKNKELESVFKQLKLKIKFNREPFLLRDKLLDTKSDKCIIYDAQFFKKLYEIKLEQKCKIISAIELDNQDIVLVSTKNEIYIILIYRLKEQKYDLIQEINENQIGYRSQYVNYGFCSRSISKKEYSVEYVKEISGNRFFCINNYGIKMYSLNEKNEYSLVLLNEYSNGIKIIYEINKNKFIFGTEKKYRNMFISY